VASPATRTIVVKMPVQVGNGLQPMVVTTVARTPAPRSDGTASALPVGAAVAVASVRCGDQVRSAPQTVSLSARVGPVAASLPDSARRTAKRSRVCVR